VPDLPHLAWPLRFAQRADGSTGFALVEQDTDDDLLSSAAVIASTPRGHRDDDPTFGVTSPLFAQGDLEPAALAIEISQSDERLQIDADELIDYADAGTRIIRASVHGRE
jgi:hypothetical protein